MRVLLFFYFILTDEEIHYYMNYIVTELHYFYIEINLISIYEVWVVYQYRQ